MRGAVVAVITTIMVLQVAIAAGQDRPAARDEEARNLFQAGRLAFHDGRYDDALQNFHRSHQLSGRAELLFNIGTCLDRLRRDAEAIAAFDAYLEAVPDAANRAEVEARVRILRVQVARASASSDPAAVESAASPPIGRRSRPAPTEEVERPVWSQWWFWTGVAVVLAAGVALAFVVGSGTETQDPLPGRDGFIVMALEAP